jgi:hypothetical protein
MQNTQTLGQHIYHDVRFGHHWLWTSAIVMSICTALCFGLQFIDGRLLNGVSVWMKPTKFFFSISVHLLTLSWAMMILPENNRRSRGSQIAIVAFLAASWIEMAYIVFRATRGEASHFNTGTPIAAMMYSLMAAGATTMMVVTGYFGVQLWRKRDGRLITDATAIGFILSAVLATTVGFYLGGQTSHWNGGDLTDATGTGFFGWSTSGGDLRVSHFIGLHAAQIIPLAALSGSRIFTFFVALAVVATTLFTFLLAVSGVPIFQM